MKTEEELNKLATDVITNVVYMVNDPQYVRDSFGTVIALMEPEDLKRLGELEPVVFYEEYGKAAPLAINGQPSFLSFKFLTKSEWDIFYPIYEKKKEALK